MYARRGSIYKEAGKEIWKYDKRFYTAPGARICVYVRICACARICVYAWVCAYKQLSFIRAYLCVCAHLCVCVCMCIQAKLFDAFLFFRLLVSSHSWLVPWGSHSNLTSTQRTCAHASVRLTQRTCQLHVACFSPQVAPSKYPCCSVQWGVHDHTFESCSTPAHCLLLPTGGALKVPMLFCTVRCARSYIQVLQNTCTLLASPHRWRPQSTHAALYSEVCAIIRSSLAAHLHILLTGDALKVPKLEMPPMPWHNGILMHDGTRITEVTFAAYAPTGLLNIL